MHRPVLYFSQILAWADDYRKRTGKWPKQHFGRIPGTLDETWLAVDMALRHAGRGLPGGSSLAQLLAEWRCVRNIKRLPPFQMETIPAWADAHHQRTGSWPNTLSGPIAEAPSETWAGVDNALRNGKRGLEGGSSLARLLAEQRGVRNTMELPPLTVEQILAWADAHRQHTGSWPNANSGPVHGSADEVWRNIDAALKQGSRGLPQGSSLARLLAARRAVRNRLALAPFTIARILAWADAHHQRTGTWPHHKSGSIAESPDDTWTAVEAALRLGARGLPGGSSLHRLLMEHGRKTKRERPRRRKRR